MPRKVKEYSLHVLANGNEVLFAELPHVPLEPLHWMRLLRDYKGPSVAHVHHVALLELRDGSTVEEINIPSIKIDGGQAFICPKPHGAGWKVHNDTFDNFTLYRRPTPTGERQTFSSYTAYLDAVGRG